MPSTFSTNVTVDDAFECFGKRCPATTTVCKRIKTISDDKALLITEIECKNDEGMGVMFKYLSFLIQTEF